MTSSQYCGPLGRMRKQPEEGRLLPKKGNGKAQRSAAAKAREAASKSTSSRTAQRGRHCTDLARVDDDDVRGLWRVSPKRERVAAVSASLIAGSMRTTEARAPTCSRG